MKSGDQIKHKLSYLSRRLTPTTRKRGRRDAAKGFRVFLGCHIIVTVHGTALLLQMSRYPPPSGSRSGRSSSTSEFPLYPAIVIVERNRYASSNDEYCTAPRQEWQANTFRPKNLDVVQEDRFPSEEKFCPRNIYFNHEAKYVFLNCRIVSIL